MRRSLAVVVIPFLSACAMQPPDDSPRVAYRQAESVQSLAVPPDLTRPESPEALEIIQPGDAANSVLPEFDGIRMVRAGPLQWLEIEGARPEELWPRMSGFLRSEGLTIRTRRPQEGLIETAWAERFDSVPKGGLGGLFSKITGAIGSDPIRDKYQIRLERMDNGTGTRVFLTHWAAQQVNTNPVNLDAPDLEMLRTQPDPAVAAEMRRRLLVYLGVSRARASAIASRAGAEQVYTAPVWLEVTKSGKARALMEEESYRRALGLVSEALRLIGADITETEEDKGNIWVRWLPPRDVRGTGLFSDDRPRRLLLKVDAQGDRIRIRAGDDKGNIRSGDVQVALLERMVDAMGGDISSFRGIESPDGDEAAPRARDPKTSVY